jgi:hypothetical protein
MKGLRTVPPGFSRGLRLPGEEDAENDDILALDEIQGPGPSDQSVLSVDLQLFILYSNLMCPAYRYQN